jgi:hypothetical protein
MVVEVDCEEVVLRRVGGWKAGSFMRSGEGGEGVIGANSVLPSAIMMRRKDGWPWRQMWIF